MSWTDFITPSSDTTSRSGLYAVDLPGVTLRLLDDLTKDEQADWEACWTSIYNRSVKNFIKDVQGRISKDFHIDLKLVSRETSKFKTTENTNSGTAGVKLEYPMPKYGRIRVNQIIVNAVAGASNFPILFYEDNTSGELLYTKTVSTLSAGKNTINIDRDFEVEDTLFIGYDADTYRLYGTENKYFANQKYLHFDDLSCAFPCYAGLNASVTQILGGGLNVKLHVYCSVEKFILENIGLFDVALWYRIGVELMKERITSDRFNRWTTLTSERALELMKIYMDEYTNPDKTGHLDLAVKDLSMPEDGVCFECKSTVSATSLIP